MTLSATAPALVAVVALLVFVVSCSTQAATGAAVSLGVCGGVGPKSAFICEGGQGLRSPIFSCDANNNLEIRATCSPLGIVNITERRSKSVEIPVRKSTFVLECPSAHPGIRGIEYQGHQFVLLCEEVPGAWVVDPKDFDRYGLRDNTLGSGTLQASTRRVQLPDMIPLYFTINNIVTLEAVTIEVAATKLRCTATGTISNDEKCECGLNQYHLDQVFHHHNKDQHHHYGGGHREQN